MATRGRRPKPTAAKKLEGNPGRRPLNENEPEPEPGIPEMPCDVAKLPAAKKFWTWAAPQLLAMKVLTMADLYVLAMASKEAAEIARLEKLLSKKDADVFVTQTGYEAQTPYVGMLDRAKKRLLQLLQEMGFTPAARSRLHVNTAGRPSDALTAFSSKKARKA